MSGNTVDDSVTTDETTEIMSDLRTCDDCGETFDTISRCRLHDCSQPEEEQDTELEPDYNDPFSPSKDGDKEMGCLHCGETFNEQEIVYEERFGRTLWWCPTEDCDGAGVGMDIRSADAMP